VNHIHQQPHNLYPSNRKRAVAVGNKESQHYHSDPNSLNTLEKSAFAVPTAGKRTPTNGKLTMSSEQATLSASISKEVCDECQREMTPKKTPATNRKYCPYCKTVFETRDTGLFDE